MRRTPDEKDNRLASDADAFDTRPGFRPSWRLGPAGWMGSTWRPRATLGGPGPVRFLPEAATAVLIGGLTYYLLNGNYYQRHGDEYVVAEPPAESRVSSEMRVLDFNGKRFYVQAGHFYQRQIDGDYVEVPRPAGL